MKPIWYFVGLMLTIIGALVLLAGLLNLGSSSTGTTVVGYVHPDIWWGALIILLGLFYVVKHHGKTAS